MASLFMGDAGSTSLGFVMAWATVSFSQHPAVWHHFSLFALPWVFAVPLLDMFSNFFRRFLEGGSPFQADTGHVHHLLRRAGLTVRQSTFVLVALSAFLAFFAVFSSLVLHAPSVFLALAFLVLFAVYAVLSYYYNKVLPSMEAATQLEASHEAVLACQEV